MNWKLFCAALTLDELNQLSNEIHETRKALITQNLSTYPAMNLDEYNLLMRDKIQGIIAYRRRTGLSLVEAKTVCDVYSQAKVGELGFDEKTGKAIAYVR